MNTIPSEPQKEEGIGTAVTPWFQPSIKPVRIGVYETIVSSELFGRIERFQHWNGVHWCGFADSVKAAHANAVYPSEYQRVKWRGLAKKPRSTQ